MVDSANHQVGHRTTIATEVKIACQKYSKLGRFEKACENMKEAKHTTNHGLKKTSDRSVGEKITYETYTKCQK